MGAVAEESPVAKEAEAGKRYRLVVRSADEAVRVIQDKFGARARVVSVKQVGGQGLSRFISSPKLEIIAEVPPEGAEPEQGEPAESFPSAPSPAEAAPEPSPETSPPVASAVPAPSPAGTSPAASPPPSPPDPGPELPPASEFEGDEQGGAPNVGRLLSRAGFDSGLMSEIRGWDHWERIKELPLA